LSRVALRQGDQNNREERESEHRCGQD
jgi:hypothetical protein